MEIITKKKSFTLEKVSELIGISPSYLSKIETGQVSPSFDVLTVLSNFYNIPLINSSDEVFNASRLTKKEERIPLDLEAPGVYVESLINRQDTIMRPTIFTALPSSGQALHSHSGEAFIHVVEGEVTFTLVEPEAAEYHLTPGDSISFQCRIPHGWKNTTEKKRF